MTGPATTPPALHLHGRLDLGDLRLEVPEEEPLEVTDGELVAVVGPNGAGKSTLLRLLAGLVGLDAGRLELDGRVVDDDTAGGFVPPATRRVGWVPQERLLFGHLTVADNVGFSPRATPEVVADLLDRLDLRGLADRRPSACSGGQAQRVAVARALAAEPHVLLLDEPSTALDADSRRRIHGLLGDQDRSGGRGRPATLLVTHDADEVAGLADRAVELASGRIVADGRP